MIQFIMIILLEHKSYDSWLVSYNYLSHTSCKLCSQRDGETGILHSHLYFVSLHSTLAFLLKSLCIFTLLILLASTIFKCFEPTCIKTLSMCMKKLSSISVACYSHWSKKWSLYKHRSRNLFSTWLSIYIL